MSFSKNSSYLLKLGTILSTKNSQNSDQILEFLKISTDFQIVFLLKYSEENFFQKSVQPAAPNFICREISQIFWKNWWVKNFQILVRKFLRTHIFLDRIKPEVVWTNLVSFLLNQELKTAVPANFLHYSIFGPFKKCSLDEKSFIQHCCTFKLLLSPQNQVLFGMTVIPFLCRGVW